MLIKGDLKAEIGWRREESRIGKLEIPGQFRKNLDPNSIDI